MSDQEQRPQPAEPIAIVALGCRFPGGIRSPREFWEHLLAGRSSIAEIPADRLPLAELYDARPATPGKIMTRWGGFIPDLDKFDAEFFGISPREAQWLDPQQRLLLEVTWEALEQGGLAPAALRGSTTGVYVGTWLNDYEARMFRDPAAIDFYMTTGTGRYAVSGRISHMFGWNGPAVTVDCACSSSLVAVHLACQALRARECSMAVAGGVNVILEPAITIAYSQSRMMAPDGQCKFGDSRADGYVRSDGAGVVVLKRLADALAAGDMIEAVIAGSAINNDGGTSGSFGTPSRVGQEDLLRKAWRHAGLPASSAWYVEAHGTGTRAGDPVELQALAAVLGQDRAKDRPLLVGSVKTNLGHTEGAAGVAGLIKVALAVKHGVVPKNLNLEELSPNVPWDQIAVEIPREATPWQGNETPTAGVSGFGIAGTNAHLVVRGLTEDERAKAARSTAPAAAAPHAPWIIPLSAASPEALAALARTWIDGLARGDLTTDSLRDAAWTACTGRSHLDHRLAAAASSPDELRAALEAYLGGEKRRGLASGGPLAAGADKIVFVFPGQGSQWLGMGRQLIASDPAFRTAIEACDAAIKAVAGWSVLEELHAGPGVARTEDISVIQPTLFAMQVALAASWQARGIRPAAIVGHSMGEVAAAHVAGALSLEDAARVICRRSALMKRVSGRGAMAVVEQTLDQARETVRPFGNRLSIAVSNSSRSTVVSGDVDAIEELLPQLEKREIFARRVKVDVASHSPHMDGVKDELGEALRELRPQAAAVRLISSVTAGPVAGPDLDARYWMRNLREPVLFSRAINLLAREGHGIFLELSPHPILVTAINQELGALGVRAVALGSLVRDENEDLALADALASLHVHGTTIDWKRIQPAGRRITLPTYPWQRERFWYDGVPWNAVGRPVSPTAATVEAKDPLEQTLHELTWIEAPGLKAPSASTSLTVQIIGDGRGLADVLAGRIGVAGHSAQIHRAMPVDTSVLAGSAIIIHLGSLDAPRFRDDAERALVAHALCGTLEIAELAKTLARDDAARAPRLYVVTAGAQAATGLKEVVSPTAGALWGFARVLSSEVPRLRCTSVDLEDGDLAGQAALLTAELLADDTERQVALRAGKRFVPRISAHHAAPRTHAVRRHLWAEDAIDSAGAARATVRQPGSLDGLVIEALRRTVPASGEIEIEIEAAGLNFMNVLSALGACPGYPRGVGPLGGDCAGRVVRMGPGVAEFKPGDRVMAAALESVTTHATVDARLAVRIPDALAPTRAATVPIAFLTAWMALEELARVRSGESVLIHAATGGVGQAALQIARWRGAKVIATAGSPEKRSWLERQGIVHVGDSRSADFVDLVRSATGGRGADVVLNCLSGDLLDAGIAALAPGGRFIELGKRDLEAGRNLDMRLLRGGRAFLTVELDRVLREDPERAGTWMRRIAELMQSGVLEPLESTVFPMARLSDALRTMSEARHLGKIVVVPEAPRQVCRAGVQRTRLEHGVSLVTGGLGALGLLTARTLVEAGARRIALVGRRAPDEAAAKAIADMQAAGADVQVVSADVSDKADVDHLVAEVTKAAPLVGIVHAAGILEDATLDTLSEAGLRRVLAGKASGALHLHRATAGLDLDFLVYFSSIAPLIGSPGQASYAAANAFLDSLAAHRRGLGLAATSIAWGPWSEGGLAAADENRGARLAEHGIPGLDNTTGRRLLEAILADAPVQAVATQIRWDRFREAWPEAAGWPIFSAWQHPETAAGAPSGPSLRESILGLRAGRERIAGMEDAVRGLVARVLRKDPARIDSTKPFRALGLDSLMGLELRGQLERAFGLSLPATLIWNHPDVCALAREIARRAELPLDHDPAPADQTDSAEIESMLQELESLSEEEARRLLGDSTSEKP